MTFSSNGSAQLHNDMHNGETGQVQGAPRCQQGEGETFLRRQAKVAVVGAGAAGLVAAKELRAEGHIVGVFEQAGQPGGTWVYDASIEEDDLLGVSDTRKQVHSSMYENLRTNIPREVMGYQAFWFGETFEDSRRFCGHREVLTYLQAFAKRFDLEPMIRYNTKVLQAVPVPVEGSPFGGPAWKVTTQTAGKENALSTEMFDALVVCNGHYTQPRLPKVEVEELYTGHIMHSHNYRTNATFAGQRVVVLGAGPSGEDLARDIADVAKDVFICARAWQNPLWASDPTPLGRRRNCVRRPMLRRLRADKRAELDDGSVLEGVDAIVYCTGYMYSFPFLSETGVISVEDNYVHPLYEQVFATKAPTLSLIGIPWKVIPFPQFELQSKWVARVLSGRAALPSDAEMEAAVAKFEEQLEPHGGTRLQRHAHMQGGEQFAYNERIAAACGEPPLPKWREDMYRATGTNKRERPEVYRDEYPDEALVAEARKWEEGQPQQLM
uniref:Flavin-containing monooxygenase n=1 Tax=Pyramimonas obovata TaxID=1411642 RepID=A0A7S0RVR3_9CHLO